MNKAICNICGNQVTSTQMRIVDKEKYEKIKHLHKIIVLDTDFAKTLQTRTFDICMVCSIKYKGKRILGSQTPLSTVDESGLNKYYDSDLLDVMNKGHRYNIFQLREIVRILQL